MLTQDWVHEGRKNKEERHRCTVTNSYLLGKFSPPPYHPPTTFGVASFVTQLV
jgi:hypothetical protein